MPANKLWDLTPIDKKLIKLWAIATCVLPIMISVILFAGAHSKRSSLQTIVTAFFCSAIVMTVLYAAGRIGVLFLRNLLAGEPRLNERAALHYQEGCAREDKKQTSPH